MLWILLNGLRLILVVLFVVLKADHLLTSIFDVSLFRKVKHFYKSFKTEKFWISDTIEDYIFLSIYYVSMIITVLEVWSLNWWLLAFVVLVLLIVELPSDSCDKIYSLFCLSKPYLLNFFEASLCLLAVCFVVFILLTIWKYWLVPSTIYLVGQIFYSYTDNDTEVSWSVSLIEYLLVKTAELFGFVYAVLKLYQTIVKPLLGLSPKPHEHSENSEEQCEEPEIPKTAFNKGTAPVNKTNHYNTEFKLFSVNFNIR